MQTLHLILFLSLFVSSVAQDCFCNLFGCFGGQNAEKVGQALDAILEGETTAIEPANPLYQDFKIDKVNTPRFDGCTVEADVDIRVTGKNGNPDQQGEATIRGTWNWCRLACFEICIDDLEVKELDFDNSPGTLVEQFGEAWINDQFDNPECF